MLVFLFPAGSERAIKIKSVEFKSPMFSSYVFLKNFELCFTSSHLFLKR